MTHAISRLALRATLAALIAGTLSCDDDPAAPRPIVQSFAAAKARWESTRPPSYTFVAERSCFCVPDAIGPVRVTVQGNAVARVIRVFDAQEMPVDMWFTVEELFTLIEQQLRDLPERLAVTYDDGRGFPSHIAYGMPEVDYGGTISVRAFVAGQ